MPILEPISELKAVTAAPKSAREQLWLDGVSFALSLALAWVFQWHASDLVWSIWLTSLITGFVMFAGWLSITAWHDLPQWKNRPQVLSFLTSPLSTLFRLVLPLTLLFTVFYVGAHLLYSVFIYHQLPLGDGTTGQTNNEPFLGMYWEIWKRYWVFLPVAFLRDYKAFLSLVKTRVFLEKEQSTFWATRFKGLLRTHILIFVLTFLPFTGSDSFFAYLAMSAVYFFPWQILKKSKSSANEETNSETKIADARAKFNKDSKHPDLKDLSLAEKLTLAKQLVDERLASETAEKARKNGAKKNKRRG